MTNDKGNEEFRYVVVDAVPEKDVCLDCGERRVDYLQNEDGKITCLSCGMVYYLK